MDNLALLQCLHPCLSATTLRHPHLIALALLTMIGRVTMTGIPRSSGDGGNYRAGPRRTEWVAGTPKPSVWTGISLRHTRRYAVESFRCTQCGFVTSFATARTDKG